MPHTGALFSSGQRRKGNTVRCRAAWGAWPVTGSLDLTALRGAGSTGRQSGRFWGAEHPQGEFGPMPWVVAAAVPAEERLCWLCLAL